MMVPHESIRETGATKCSDRNGRSRRRTGLIYRAITNADMSVQSRSNPSAAGQVQERQQWPQQGHGKYKGTKCEISWQANLMVNDQISRTLKVKIEMRYTATVLLKVEPLDLW
jgi:hypothetical protein